MTTYVILIDYTDQGIRAIGDSPRRADTFAEQARGAGVTVRETFWTLGSHDGVLILDAPDDTSLSALLLSLGRAGNVRTHALRAYRKEEMTQLLARLS